MEGVCVDVGATLALQKGRKYYLFDHGSNNYYVSKFDNEKAHFGSFQRKCFELIESEPSQEVIFKDRNDPQKYVGEIIKPYKGYEFKIGEQYVLGVVEYPGVYKGGEPATSFYLYTIDDLRFRGCMPASIFKILGPFDLDKLKTSKTVQIEPEAVMGVNTLANSKTSENEANNEPRQIQYEQLDLFSLMEG